VFRGSGKGHPPREVPVPDGRYRSVIPERGGVVVANRPVPGEEGAVGCDRSRVDHAVEGVPRPGERRRGYRDGGSHPAPGCGGRSRAPRSGVSGPGLSSSGSPSRIPSQGASISPRITSCASIRSQIVLRLSGTIRTVPPFREISTDSPVSRTVSMIRYRFCRSSVADTFIRTGTTRGLSFANQSTPGA